MGCKLFNPQNNSIDWKLVLGAFCFGLGWGIGGLCPGPAIMLFSVFTVQIGAVWFGAMIVGQQLAGILDKATSKPKSEENKQVDQTENLESSTIQQKMI